MTVTTRHTQKQKKRKTEKRTKNKAGIENTVLQNIAFHKLIDRIGACNSGIRGNFFSPLLFSPLIFSAVLISSMLFCYYHLALRCTALLQFNRPEIICTIRVAYIYCILIYKHESFPTQNRTIVLMRECIEVETISEAIA